MKADFQTPPPIYCLYFCQYSLLVQNTCMQTFNTCSNLLSVFLSVQPASTENMYADFQTPFLSTVSIFVTQYSLLVQKTFMQTSIHLLQSTICISVRTTCKYTKHVCRLSNICSNLLSVFLSVHPAGTEKFYADLNTPAPIYCLFFSQYSLLVQKTCMQTLIQLLLSTIVFLSVLPASAEHIYADFHTPAPIYRLYFCQYNLLVQKTVMQPSIYLFLSTVYISVSTTC